MRSKKLTMKEIRDILMAHEDALGMLAKAYAQQAAYFANELVISRQLAADQGAQLARLEKLFTTSPDAIVAIAEESSATAENVAHHSV